MPAGAAARTVHFHGRAIAGARDPGRSTGSPSTRDVRAARPPRRLPGDAGREPALPRRRGRPQARDPGRSGRPARPRGRRCRCQRRAAGRRLGDERRLHRPRLRRLHRALLADDGGLGRLALPRDRRLHRRRQPGLLAAEPDRELGQRPDRRRLAPDPDLRRPAGADQQLQQLRQAQRRPGDRPGGDAAVDAVAQASAVGIGPGSPIYFDMESYTPGSSASAATLAFLEAWTNKLHSLGYVSGVYSSSASGIADLADQLGSGYVGPTTSGSPTGTASRAPPTPSSPPTPGPATSGSTSTAAATTRPTAG